MAEKIVHSFEAGRRGKPDELDANLAHAIGAYFLSIFPHARFDLRVAGGFPFREDRPLVKVSGEISQGLFEHTSLEQDIRRLVANHYNIVHRTNLGQDTFLVQFGFKPQTDTLAVNGHAGDSGNPIAVAYGTGPNFLPWERYLAVGIRDLIDATFQGTKGGDPRELAEVARNLQGLRADGKVGVTAVYEDEGNARRLVEIRKIVIAAEHERSLPVTELRKKLTSIVRAYMVEAGYTHRIDLGQPDIIINGLGDWNEGGWKVDEGTREAKPYRDFFSTYGCNEDSAAGEDPTKPSGTGTFLARHIAVQLAAHGADFARVALDYVIGQECVDLDIITRGGVPQDVAEAWVREHLPLRISDGIKQFGLRNPELYNRVVAASDFFQSPELPWNQVGEYAPPPQAVEVKELG